MKISKPQQDRTQEMKELFIENFLSSLANISVCCRKVGISRQTFYDWQKNDDDFAVDVKNVQDELLDFAESVLFKKVRDGSTAELIFFLKTKGKSRGYVERQEISTDGGWPLFEVKIIDNTIDVKHIEERDTNE